MQPPSAGRFSSQSWSEEVSNSVKERLAAGSAVRGVFWSVADASLAEFVATLGWDFLIADLEHSAMSLSDVEDCARACQVRKNELFVRLPLDAGSDISRALDAGASGIVVPYVESAADARKVTDLVKYPPGGRRGLAPMRGADFGMSGDLGEYTVNANKATTVVVQIESAEGLRALPEILDVDGVDVVFAGVLDLSMSLGAAGRTDSQEVRAAMREIAEQTRRAGKIFGTYGSDPNAFDSCRAMGATLMTTALEEIIMLGSNGFLNR